MKTSITFRHMDTSEALKNYVNERLSRVDKYLIDPAEAHVVLLLENHRHIADITVREKNLTAKGLEKSNDMYASIDGAVDKVEKTLRRYKDKLKAKQ